MRKALAFIALITPGAAWAYDGDGLRGFSDGGFYIRADAGLGLETDQAARGRVTVDNVDPAQADEDIAGSADFSLPEGFLGDIGFGWAAPNSGLRLEALLVHDRRGRNVLVTDGDTFFDINARMRTLGLYGLALYDFNPNQHVQPFVGLGVGFNRVEFDVEDARESDTQASGLATAGLSFILNEHVVGELAYRYQYTPDLRHVWTDTDNDPIVGYDARAQLDTDLSEQSVMVGVRYMMRPARAPRVR